ARASRLTYYGQWLRDLSRHRDGFGWANAHRGLCGRAVIPRMWIVQPLPAARRGTKALSTLMESSLLGARHSSAALLMLFWTLRKTSGQAARTCPERSRRVPRANPRL